MEKYISDSHNDFLTELKSEIEYAKYINQIKKYGLKILSCAVWTSELEKPINFIQKCHTFLKEQNILNLDINLLLSIEDLFFVDSKNIETLIDYKPISCGLTWNNDNNLSGGCLSDNGVTQYGKSIIKELEENNILIDTAHLNRKAFYDVANLSQKSMYNSHCCVNSLNDNARNLTDEQIRVIVDSNGFIGLCFVGGFLTNKNHVSSRDVAKHICYILDKFGCDNIGIGSDFNGTKELPVDLTSYDFNPLKNELKKMGVNDDIVDRIFYRNYKEFLIRNNLIKDV